MPPVVHAPMLSPKWSIATEGLDAEERQFILDRMRPLSFDPRAILFDQGEPSDTLVLLTEGRVRLYQTLESGEEFTFGLCIAGAILGLAALVTREPRILSAVALEPVTASVMTRTDFMNCLNMVPRFHWNITRLLAILALQSIERSGPLVLDSAAVRLCSTLKSLARQESGDAAGLRLHVDGLTQEELAKMVGVSRNWIAIALGELERLGLITKRRGHITIISARRLDAFIVGARNH
ncbi:cAMP-binding domain of CRP or a regulatory subunit of cAMP-dependent protein kinases [Bradyrhizobium lablabi]|uniref:cAMP-binding domain of CRP or a regulatory subunit of cAMP-dependent protein kinases n=1 Tax=Bradyrhizobium lablabi TaxID=722472 RepID=A0A1M6QG63_9BRAD|nr:Crp/Fnr family transcriptional regulator [Bradyrhizobium lablabi]SHK19047.1 cAMP-binding domain of CRP or a regulatory subunit of cAMP-dependent protein kinases [Bradyrhizobium lablabi]